MTARIVLWPLIAAALALWGAAAFWVAGHPPALSSDDALFFQRGLMRFSILDFSPQFPGYPGFVLMGRGLATGIGTPLSGLAALGAGMALTLPWAAACIAVRAGTVPQHRWAALAAFLLVLVMPLGPDLALSLLSDGAGVLFVLAGLALLPRPTTANRVWPWALASGIALGWALACRPTNLVLVLALAIGASVAAPRRLWPLWLGGALVLLPVVAALLVLEPLYLVEAHRFTRGHAEIWGNVALGGFGSSTWWDTACKHPMIACTLCAEALAMFALLFQRGDETRPLRWALVAGFAGHTAWILGFQNPESLRHLAPLMVLGALGPALLLGRVAQRWQWIAGTVLALMLVQASALGRGTNWQRSTLPPLMQAANLIRSQPDHAILITNHGVALMRRTLPDQHIHDAYYAGSAALAATLAQGPVWRLSSTPLPGHHPTRHFDGRFIGERDMWLYQIK